MKLKAKFLLLSFSFFLLIIFISVIPSTYVNAKNSEAIVLRGPNYIDVCYPNGTHVREILAIDPESTIYAGAGDGGINYLGPGDWDEVHNAAAGTGAYPSTTSHSVRSQSDLGNFRIQRIFFPFDTSDLDDDATLISGLLKAWVNAKSDEDNDGKDYVVVVQTSQASTATLTLDDYDTCGAVHTPTEGSDRKDIGTITIVSYNTWTLNSDGLNWINLTGWTKLGLREGHDIEDEAMAYDCDNSVSLTMSEQGGTDYDPKLVITYTVPSNTPTNDELTLDLTGANYKGTKTLLTAKQDYKFVYKGSDLDGVTNINYAQIQLDPTGKNVTLRVTRGTGDAWTFSEQSDPSDYVTLNVAGSSHSTSGTQKTFNFLVKFNWAWGDSADDVTVRCFIIDEQSTSDQDDYSNIFGVECHLESASLLVSDYRCNPSQTLTFSGYWYYNGTMVAPPNGDYQVKIKLSGIQKGTTDTTLVSGAFSISDVTAESTVNSYTYQVFADYNISAGTFSSVVVDKARVYYEELDDVRTDVNANIEFRVKVLLLYDNHAFGTGDTVTANFGSLTWDSGNSWFDGSRTQATIGSYVFQVSSLTEATYGITTFEINVTDPTGNYDRIRIDTLNVVDSHIDINSQGTFYATASLELDNHALGSGDALTLSGHVFTWVASNNRFEYNTTQSSVIQITVNSFTSGSEATYGITVGNINSQSTSIIWDRIQVSFSANATNPITNQVVLFTVNLTREFDSSSITSFSYNINRNGSGFGNPHTITTFTDIQASEITYVYDFASVTDNTYGLTVFVDPTDITVTWTSTNVAPTITNLVANSNQYANKYFLVNATIRDDNSNFLNASITLNGTITLAWISSTNIFSIYADPNFYCTLDASNSIKTIINVTTYKLSWKIQLYWNYTEGTIDITSAIVYDTAYLNGTNSAVDIFTFERDIIVYSAAQNPSKIYVSDPFQIQGTIRYNGTSIIVENTTGLTVYVSLAGTVQSNTSASTYSFSLMAPSEEGMRIYLIYANTVVPAYTNYTLSIYFHGSGTGPPTNPTIPTPQVNYYIVPTNLGLLQLGQQKQFAVPLSWSGVNEIIVNSVTIDGTWIQSIQTFPQRFYRGIGEANGTGYLYFSIDIPQGAREGEHFIQISVFASAQASTVNLGTTIEFTVTVTPTPPPPVQNIVAILLACSLVAVFFGASKKVKLHKRSPV